MFLSTHKLSVALLLAAMAAPFSARADEEEEHFDIYLARPTVGTQTVFGGVAEGGTTSPEVGLRVFEAIFALDDLNGIFFGEEPGFNNPGTTGIQGPGAMALTPGDTFSVAEVPVTLGDVMADLLFWDGTGMPNFQAAAAGVDFQVDTAGLPGAAADGSFDDHPVLLLVDGDTTNATTPPEGVYVASFTASIDGLDPTDPLLLVIGTSEAIEPAVETAIEFVEASLVPEPSSAALLLAIVAGAAMRRRTA